MRGGLLLSRGGEIRRKKKTVSLMGNGPSALIGTVGVAGNVPSVLMLHLFWLDVSRLGEVVVQPKPKVAMISE